MSNKTSDKNVANDIKILKKFCEYEEVVVLTDNALEEVQDAMQNILAEREQKDKRIQELEKQLQKYYNGELYTAKQLKNLENNQKKYFINKQVVIDKMEELNKEIKNSDEIDAIFKIKQQQVLQELLETK